MEDKHEIAPDGVREDGVSAYPIDQHDRMLLDDARMHLSQHRMPVLLPSDNPTARLFVSALDGTGNDRSRDPFHTTNVAAVAEQIENLKGASREAVRVGYVRGPGTQENAFTRLVDGATGHSYESNLEKMYYLLAIQAKAWLRENANAEISIANIGFSRGGEQSAGFSRLVDELGIADPDSRIVSHDEHGNTVVTYTRTLVPPGRTAQVAVLIDPVPTGEPAHHDRRLPPSVLAAVQFTSEDERRWLFRASRHIPFGTSDDGRFTNVWVPGAHSDGGGGYHRNGVSTRVGNMAIDVLNALSDRPFLTRRPERDDPRLDVVHRSEEGSLLYRLTPKVNRHNPNGTRDDLGGPDCRRQCDRAEAADPVLASRYDWQAVAIGAAPVRAMAAAKSEVDALFERISAAALAGDAETARIAGRDYLRSDDGQQLQHQARALTGAADRLWTTAAEPAMTPPEAAPEALRQPVHALHR